VQQAIWSATPPLVQGTSGTQSGEEAQACEAEEARQGQEEGQIRKPERGRAVSTKMRMILVAVMASIFAAQGGYQTGQTFVDGLKPALVTGAAVVALAGVATLLIPTRRRAAELVAVADAAESTGGAESAGGSESDSVLEAAGR